MNIESGAVSVATSSDALPAQLPVSLVERTRPSGPKTVRIDLRPQRDVSVQRTLVPATDHSDAMLSFGTIESFIKTLTLKRWQLVQKMQGAGPMSLRAAARRIARDVKGVHSDVHALLNAGLLVRNADGRIECPYDHIHVEFDVRPEGFGASPGGESGTA
ncbi:MAG: transcriptional regulator [Burkholderiaceae bacterium]